MIELTPRHYGRLIAIALSNKTAFVTYYSMLQALINRPSKKYGTSRYHLIAALANAGLISVTQVGLNRGNLYLTETGKQAIRDMPDDLHTDWYPLPIDISAAKERVKK